MKNFIKSWIGSLASAAMLFGTLFAGYCVWTMFEERSVASTPEILEAAQLDHSGELTYATVNGGTLDLTNTFSYEVRRKRRSRRALTTSYFIPVLNDSNQVAYILETSADPGSLSASEALSHTGLLQVSSKMPQKLQDSYAEIHGDQEYPLLDSAYKPKGLVEKFGLVAAGLIVAIAGFFVRKLLFRRPAY